MKNLISMTDFVLSQTTPDWLELCEFEENSYKIYNYAKFLKQPLELWMFVPCDESGSILEKPKDHGQTEVRLHRDFTRYQQTKERCLFDGYVFINNGKYSTLIAKNSEGSGQINIMEGIIEDLVKHNLQLTKTALKQIGL